MRYLWLMGGFGNVLFQMLAFRVVQKKDSKPIKYICFLTEKNILTKCIKWSIHDRLYEDFISKDQFSQISTISALRVVFVATLSKIIGHYFSYASFYNQRISLCHAPLAKNIFGYFQEKSFLSNHIAEIHTLGEDIRTTMNIHENNLTVVHYRKGDSSWAERNLGYYEKVRDRINDLNEEVIVVTDSKNAAEEFFKNIAHVKISSSTSAKEDFKIMLRAKKLFCAPSTFSWWAAHTLPADCVVIAPKFLDELLGFYTKSTLEIY